MENPIRVTFPSTSWDEISQNLVVITELHHEVHTGDTYVVNYSATGKNAGQTINVYMKTGSKSLHMVLGYSGSGAVYGRILEAAIVTANTGTNAQPVYNRNRNSGKTSNIYDNATSPAAGVVGVDVTVTGNGTIIYAEYSGAAKQVGGQGRDELEFVLKPNTPYVFQCESNAAGIVINLNLSWYE